MDKLYEVASCNLDGFAEAFDYSFTILLGIGIPALGFFILVSLVLGFCIVFFDFIHELFLRMKEKRSKSN